MIDERTLSINSLMASIGERSRFAVAALVLHGLVFFLSLLTWAGEAGIQPPTTERRTAFLSAVEGPWEGQACVTPIGPRLYDMTFVRTAPGRSESLSSRLANAYLDVVFFVTAASP